MGRKDTNFGSATRKYVGKAEGQIDRDVHGKTDSLKLICPIYILYYSLIFL